MINSSIPNAIEQTFKSLSETYGNNRIKLLGTRNGTEYFIFDFPDDVDVGFPQIVGYANGEITNIEDLDAVNLASSFATED